MDWDDLRHFLALARHGSIRAAGASLAVSHTTVARRVDLLEERLGTRLFDRHRDGYSLTVAGRGLLERAARVEDEISALSREIAGQDARLVGPVRVTVGDEVMAGLVLDDLATWAADHPGVELAITTDARSLNLARGEADLAVRVLTPHTSPPEYLVGQRVAPLVLANYVGRAHAMALDPAQGASRWLGYGDPRGILELLRTSSYPDLPIWGAFSTLDLMMRALKRGLGVAALPTYVGDSDPELVRLPHADARHVADLWLLHHPDLKANARVHGARAALRAGFARREDLFAGRCAHAPVRSNVAPSPPDEGPIRDS